MRQSGLVLALLVGCVAALQAQAPGQAAPAALSGVVTDATTGRPIEGASVSLRRTEGGLATIPRMVTDAKGRFVFRDLPPAPNYFMDVSRFGYATMRYGWSGPDGSLAFRDMSLINLAPDQWVDNIKISLYRYGAISGRVTDERGEPVVGTAVRAYSQRTIAGRPQLVAGPIAVTDDRGVYRLASLTPAKYVVAALSVQHTVLDTTPDAQQERAVGELATGGIGAGSASSVKGPTIDVSGRHRLALTNYATPPPPSSSQSRAYPATFYPAATRASDATPIELNYGDSRTSIDFQLRPAATVRVSGRLAYASGVPAQLLLRLLPAGTEYLGFGAEAATTVSETDGSFTFLNVPEGDYTLLAQASVIDFTSGNESVRFADAPGFPGGGITVGSMRGVPGLGYLARAGAPSAIWSRMPLAVGGRDLDGVVVQMHPTVSVRGRIAFAEGMKPPAATRGLALQMYPANGDTSLGMPSGRTAAGDTTFQFEITGLMASAYLFNNGFLGNAIASVTWDGREVVDTGLDASAGRDFDNVVVTVTDKKAGVSGVVSGSNGPAAAAVIAFPADRARWTNYGWAPARILAARSNQAGVFDIDDLVEGDYLVIAVPMTKFDAWTDARFLAAAAPLATPLSIKWGEKKSVTLTLQEVIVK